MGTLLYTTDSGITWRHQRGGATQLPGGDVVLQGIHFVDKKTGWAVGEAGTILHTQNGGKNWESQSSPSHLLSGMHFSSSEIGYVVGDRGAILSTNDGGSSWTSQDSGIMECFGATYFVTPKIGWAVAEWGTIIQTKDGGITWWPQKTESS